MVWFDAHADLNTPLTTPTGYLGGMALAGATGLWNTQLGSGPAISQVILVGTREIDPSEQAVIDDHRIPIVPVEGDVPATLVQAIAGRPVYVHLDCDVLDPDIVPTDYAADRGLDNPRNCAPPAPRLPRAPWWDSKWRSWKARGTTAALPCRLIRFSRPSSPCSRDSQRLGAALHDLPHRRDLPGVTAGVLGGVEHQPDDGGRQAGASDAASIEQRPHIGLAHLRERAVDALLRDGNRLGGRRGWVARHALGLEPRELLRRE